VFNPDLDFLGLVVIHAFGKRFSYSYVAVKPLENISRFVISVFLMTNLG